MDEATITPALDEIRGLVQADGGDMVLTSVDGGTIVLRLVVEGAHCVECVMPREFLEQVALDVFQRSGVAAESVVVDDPREHPDFVMPEH
jgi:Fe-S cluster biogenesis protein NfuA